jgi:hypothetical protein
VARSLVSLQESTVEATTQCLEAAKLMTRRGSRMIMPERNDQFDTVRNVVVGWSFTLAGRVRNRHLDENLVPGIGWFL